MEIGIRLSNSQNMELEELAVIEAQYALQQLAEDERELLVKR